LKNTILTLGPKTEFVRSISQSFSGSIELEEKKFPDGEFFVRIPKNIRNQNCYLVVHMIPENIFDVIITIDTLRRAHAGKITLVTPYLPYSRQDRRADTRTPISARVLADMLETAGCNHVITMDVHALQVEGFYKIPFDNLQGASLLLNTIVFERSLKDYVLVAPDAGAAKRTRFLGDLHSVPVAVLDKKRISDTEVESILIGEVKDKTCIMIDDIISSGGTLAKGCEVLITNGAKEVIAACSHMLSDLSQNETLKYSKIKHLYHLDTATFTQPFIYGAKDRLFDWHHIVKAEDLFVDAIYNDINGLSIASMFNQSK
jgi:ribose-phosphate pyrophosphokinase